MAFAVVARIGFAPFSGHGDLETFWFSAQRFMDASFHFYYYVHTPAGMWVYPPLSLWIVTGSYLASFASTAYDPAFLFLVKVPMIVADVAVAYVLYRLLGDKRGLLAATFWLANPMSIFITSIFGQLDPLVPALLAISILGLTRNKVFPSAIVYGASIMTKQYAIFAAPPLIACLLRNRGRGDAFRFTLGIVVTAFLISFPFLLSGSREVYFKEIWLTRSGADYDDLCCQFAGLFQFLSWLHYQYEMELLPLFHLSYPALFGMLGLVTGIALNCKKMDYARSCLISMATFLSLSWYINPQYTVVFIPFTIYDVLAHGSSRFWLIATLLPFLWPLSANGFAPYFRGAIGIPALGEQVAAISALVFFVFLFGYMMMRLLECLEVKEDDVT